MPSAAVVNGSLRVKIFRAFPANMQHCIGISAKSKPCIDCLNHVESVQHFFFWTVYVSLSSYVFDNLFNIQLLSFILDFSTWILESILALSSLEGTF